MSQELPLIGLPAGVGKRKGKQYLEAVYVDAILHSGGIPVMIPLTESPPEVFPLVGRLDGLLLTGSNSDVDPSRYGMVAEEKCGPVEPLRDRMDCFLLEFAVNNKTPILAICYGMQSLNVYMGGSLIQDLPTHFDTLLEHNCTGQEGRPCHPIEIAGGSILEQMAGSQEAEVNSTHHQAVDRMGRGLQTIAHSPDGVVESILGNDPEHWILGVQWHPEKTFATDQFSRGIFERFLSHCKDR
jgi:putative glutamine amidotransferase